MSEHQEDVLTNLLDLQAELRGDEPGPRDDSPQASSEAAVDAEAAGDHEAVAVTEEGLTVSVSPAASPVRADGRAVNERLAALQDRLARLEYELAGVTTRIERIEPDPEMDPSATPGADVDARWRSFVDLQKMVADRLDHR